jgi:hypothetical protein
VEECCTARDVLLGGACHQPMLAIIVQIGDKIDRLRIKCPKAVDPLHSKRKLEKEYSSIFYFSCKKDITIYICAKMDIHVTCHATFVKFASFGGFFNGK